MNSILRSPGLRKGLLLFAMVLFLALVPSLIGSPVNGVSGESARAEVLSGSSQGGQQPTVGNSISGTISYCAGPPKKVPNATVATTSGSPSGMDDTDSVGFYQINDLGVGPYTIAPSKTGAVSGISAFDAGLVAQFVAGITTPSSCQQLAGDASNNGALSAFDAGLIAQTVAAIPNAGIAGTWKFVPSSRNYVSLPGSLTDENYDAVLVGDVSGNWTPAGPEGSPKGLIGGPAGGGAVAVSLPDQAAAPAATNVMVPVFVDNTTGQGIIGYDFTFTFMTTVIQPASPAFETIGTLSAGWSIIPITSTPGQIRIVAFNAMPLSGSGTLIFLKFNVVGSLGAMTPLNWTNFVFNEGTPAANPLTNGKFTVAGTTAVKLVKFTANEYDKGVYLEWQTGYEAANLGFNIYREVVGERTLVNPEIIAGSALMAGTATKLQAGQSYGWWDNAGENQRNARYWIEEIDLNGLRIKHGPFGVRRVGGSPPRESQAELLSHVGRGEPTVHQLPLNHELSRADSVHAEVSTLAAAPKLSALPALKLTIREEGWYRVTQQDLTAAGFDAGRNPRNLQLYLSGIEQPIRVVGEQDGRVDAIEFFATGQDKATTDARVYWLVSGDAAGSRIGVVKAEGKSAGVRSFPFTVERRDRTIYFSGLRNGDADNFFGRVLTSRPVDHTITLQHLDSNSSDQAEVEVALQGVTDQAAGHSVRVLVNGLQVGKLVFSGQSHKAQKFTLSRELLKEGDNIVTLAAETADSDVSLVDYIRLTYPHSYTTDQDSLRMSVGSGSQTIEGFSDGSVRVFDITDPSAPVELAGKVFYQGGSYAVSVEMAGQGTRTLLALTDSRIKTPASMTLNESSNWRNKKNKADLLIITRSEFFAALEPLKALRESQGLRVQMVDIADIFDEFSDGERTPQAVKDFLSTATTTWKRKPAFVLFAGHASLDPRNHLGFGDSDLVPTKLIDTRLMETASDDWFVDFNEDGLPELAVGRLPFRTHSEAVTMVSKILSYERSQPATEALLVADANEGYDFEAASGQARDMLPTSLKVNRIDRGRVDAAAAKTEMMDAINRGQKIVNYTGHGSVNQWKGDLLTNDDARGLTNADHLSLFVMMTCLNGYFQDAALDSLAESLLKAEHGGAVAVWASSGMTNPEGQSAINQQLYKLLFGGGLAKDQTLTLGEAVMKAKAATGDSDVRRTWVLLGDPTMRLK